MLSVLFSLLASLLVFYVRAFSFNKNEGEVRYRMARTVSIDMQIRFKRLTLLIILLSVAVVRAIV